MHLFHPLILYSLLMSHYVYFYSFLIKLTYVSFYSLYIMDHIHPSYYSTLSSFSSFSLIFSHSLLFLLPIIFVSHFPLLFCSHNMLQCLIIYLSLILPLLLISLKIVEHLHSQILRSFQLFYLFYSYLFK